MSFSSWGKTPPLWPRCSWRQKILALAGVPARVVHGIALKEQKERLPVVHWLEIYNKKWWQAIDPVTGAPGIPDNYLAWWRGPLPMARLTGGSDLHVTLSVTRELEAAINTAVVRGQIKKPLLLKFSLLSLPIHSQQVYRILLMVPVGGFLLVILRNIIGISTFGTFMPVLIALAFRETQLLWGIVFFSSLVALGLTIRFYLDRLKLLLVPRLAAVLIVVVILMALMSIFTNRLGIERGLSVALFPMVILTMTIERMSIVWEERGPYEAIKQGLGSLLAAALAYLVMHNREVQHLFFVFPELLLVLLAATLLLGRYSGYRLVELLRFKVLTQRGQVMFGLGRRLADLGIMGINRRNAEFTLAHNPRRYYPLVDDKLRTKELAAAAGIPVPELYGVVQSEYQVRHLPAVAQRPRGFRHQTRPRLRGRGHPGDRRPVRRQLPHGGRPA